LATMQFMPTWQTSLGGAATGRPSSRSDTSPCSSTSVFSLVNHQVYIRRAGLWVQILGHEESSVMQTPAAGWSGMVLSGAVYNAPCMRQVAPHRRLRGYAWVGEAHLLRALPMMGSPRDVGHPPSISPPVCACSTAEQDCAPAALPRRLHTTPARCLPTSVPLHAHQAVVTASIHTSKVSCLLLTPRSGRSKPCHGPVPQNAYHMTNSDCQRPPVICRCMHHVPRTHAALLSSAGQLPS
jgi:hypothetical protein